MVSQPWNVNFQLGNPKESPPAHLIILRRLSPPAKHAGCHRRNLHSISRVQNLLSQELHSSFLVQLFFSFLEQAVWLWPGCWRWVSALTLPRLPCPANTVSHQLPLVVIFLQLCLNRPHSCLQKIHFLVPIQASGWYINFRCFYHLLEHSNKDHISATLYKHLQ